MNGCAIAVMSCENHPPVEEFAAFPGALSLMAFAIIKTGGRQYRVSEGDTIDLDLLEGDSGKKIVLEEVLMHGDGENVTHGAPIDGATVTAEIVEQRKDKKVIAFKFKRRKGYHRTVGHRRKLTRVKITGIKMGGTKKKKETTE
jgi:large subunit ribosomal protein L21